ncbi:hypothetical protein [Lentzea sp. NEAU-D7]|uniref:hypothetical protein n=1 Tax=Lentzea sp. NEAU-D7 TaxID=2994667 RepID=UPI00224A81AD|nr:hypothetical protein [Lentzea sp. NEAU-D7]MCX2950235.1 hypothetical protein [Lentzea sp. NEAU-D7]
MDSNALRGPADSPGVGASGRDRRVELLAGAAGVRGACPGPVGEAWESGGLAEVTVRVPRSGVLFGKVA